MTSIKGALGLILDPGRFSESPGKLQSMLEVAYNNSERLIRLINDILDIEKVEAGKMEFQMMAIDLVQLLGQALEANKG